MIILNLLQSYKKGYKNSSHHTQTFVYGVTGTTAAVQRYCDNAGPSLMMHERTGLPMFITSLYMGKSHIIED